MFKNIKKFKAASHLTFMLAFVTLSNAGWGHLLKDCFEASKNCYANRRTAQKAGQNPLDWQEICSPWKKKVFDKDFRKNWVKLCEDNYLHCGSPTAECLGSADDHIPHGNPVPKKAK